MDGPELKRSILNCRVCELGLPHEPRPIASFQRSSKILVVGQAPGRKVHESGIAWDDKSGDNLRKWLGVTKAEFYNDSVFAIVPMGFCYPGTGKSGDLPPRKECATKWHGEILNNIDELKLTLLIGKYAQDYYLKKRAKRNLTQTVRSFEDYLPEFFVLPHPSPRNNIWMKKNDWFGDEVLPILGQTVNMILNTK